MGVIKGLFGSKKAIASIVTVICNLIVGFLPGEAMDADTKTKVMGAITAVACFYLLGQGKADEGKEAAKIAADASGGSGS